jgi:anti-sigma B factor antagonist
VRIVVRKANSVTVLDLMGALVWGQPAEDFVTRIRELLSAGNKNLAVNLANVSYVDSGGVGALFAAHASIQTVGAKSKLFAVPQVIIRVLERVHLDKVFELFEDEASALASF